MQSMLESKQGLQESMQDSRHSLQENLQIYKEGTTHESMDKELQSTRQKLRKEIK